MNDKYVVFPLKKIGRKKEVNLDLFSIFDNIENANLAKAYINNLDMECIIITCANYSNFDEWKKIIESNLKNSILDNILIK